MSTEEKLSPNSDLSNVFDLTNKLTPTDFPECPEVGEIGTDVESIAKDVPVSIIPELPTILLADTKNKVETITVPQTEQTIINGKYTLDYEDDTYYHCYHQTTYRVKVMKDSARANIKYRDSKGRLLPGYSLVNEAKSTDTVTFKKKKKKFTSKTAQEYMEKDLLGDAIELILNGDMKDESKSRALLELLKFQKPTLSKSTSESVVKIQNNEFDEPDTL